MALSPSDLVQLRDDAARFLSRFVDPARAADRLADTLALRPAEGDAGRVFTEAAAPLARAAYAQLWANIAPIAAKPGQSTVLAWICESDRFASADGKRFPGGYQKVADRLVAGVPWVCWKFVEPGATQGIAYDGLVRLDDRWAWFPKPWKLLGANVSALDYLTD